MGCHDLAAPVASQNAECLVGPNGVAANVIGGKQRQPAVAVLLVNLDQFGHLGKRQRDATRASRRIGMLEKALQQIGGATGDGEGAKPRSREGWGWGCKRKSFT